MTPRKGPNMKQTAPWAVLCTFLLCCTVTGQEPQKTPEPEYVAQPHYLDSKTQSLVSLERQMAARKWKTKALGFGGGRLGYELKGGKSPVRFHAGSKMEFVVRVESFNKRSPEEILQLSTLKEKKDKRELITTKIGPMGTGSTTDQAAGAVAFTAHRYGDSSFKITPSSPLPAGEYAIRMTVAPGTFFCFGVDPPRQ